MVLVMKVKENRRQAFSQSLPLRARNMHTHMYRDSPIKISNKNTGRQPHTLETTHAREFESCFPCLAMQELILAFHLPYYVLTGPYQIIVRWKAVETRNRRLQFAVGGEVNKPSHPRGVSIISNNQISVPNQSNLSALQSRQRHDTRQDTLPWSMASERLRNGQPDAQPQTL
jgi:hypothetical protein